tara:strand:- start:264 stop:578 length:315 start_codon:yes stop_codon:yes gene_type:complete
MFYLVWKQGKPYNNWVITEAKDLKELRLGGGVNRPEWFSNRKDALNFIRENFRKRFKLPTNGFLGYKYVNRPADTYVYRRGGHSYGSPQMVKFHWEQNWTYLGV